MSSVVSSKKGAAIAIWAIAGPAILANSSAPLVGLVDTWVIGHMPNAQYLAAVGVGATIFSFIFWAFGFLRMSTTGLVAQAYGTEDLDQIARILLRSLALGLLVAFALLILQPLILHFGLTGLAPPAPVQPYVVEYYHIRVWSAPATLALYSLTGYLIGTTRAKAALAVQLLLNITNVALNLLFVMGLDMGVKGIALGSLIAEWLAAGFALLLAFQHLSGGRLIAAFKNPECWQVSKMGKLMSTNGYIFLRTLLLMAVLLFVTRKAASLGTGSLAASQVMMTFMMLISLGLDAFANAAEALSGAAFGRGLKKEFRFWIFATTKWALMLALLYSAIFYLAGDIIINGLTDIPSVRLEAHTVLPALALLPLVSVFGYQLDGIYVGATEGRGMFLTMLAACALFFLIVDGLANKHGLLGLWLAFAGFSAGRGIAQLLYYPRLEKRLNRA